MEIDFDKNNGLVPAIVQDADTGKVLMMGYMNMESYNTTIKTNKVTFYSRSKHQLWTKGETSGHYLTLISMSVDCDGDTLLVKAIPHGPTCHTGADTCWSEINEPIKVENENINFLLQLQATIKKRHLQPTNESYTSSLFAKGINKIAQKVGEEAVELVIEAKDDNADLFLGEAADLLFHYMVLLESKGVGLTDVLKMLKERHK
ncbi:MAG: bifunctional phosphoribosyl-AMP cyclohydrolase/phosphoribosyl-ATP diphosphatase HisIE [Cytophagales bacterium]|nr:bifunctional phosphoribosyl-AMP cyclohydrolase/phosphoribosyl-ATP diphosphatase HisIE [Cytophagales bacterium]